jgi:hypothetical protein
MVHGDNQHVLWLFCACFWHIPRIILVIWNIWKQRGKKGPPLGICWRSLRLGTVHFFLTKKWCMGKIEWQLWTSTLKVTLFKRLSILIHLPNLFYVLRNGFSFDELTVEKTIPTLLLAEVSSGTESNQGQNVFPSLWSPYWSNPRWKREFFEFCGLKNTENNCDLLVASGFQCWSCFVTFLKKSRWAPQTGTFP